MSCETAREAYIPSTTKLEALWPTPVEKSKRDAGLQHSQWESIHMQKNWQHWEDRLDCTKKRFMNYTIHKTTVRKLQKPGISNDKIAAITGHHNKQSLQDYAMADMQDHQQISSILSKTCAVYINNGCSSSSTSQLALHPALGHCSILCTRFTYLSPLISKLYCTNCMVYVVEFIV